jgi:phosphatidylglycerol:prolipoprotein diacylglycerol transferase
MRVLIGVMVGARFMYVAVEIAKGSEVGRQFLHEPERMLFIWEGGLVMYGGLFGALLAGFLCTRKYGLDVRQAMDLGLPAGFVGLAIGRIGCLLVGDDYGKPLPEGVELPFPIALRVPDPLPAHSLFDPANQGQLLYATQVWMSANALALALYGFWRLRRPRPAGVLSLELLLLYALVRGAIESFRGDSVRGLWFSQTLSTSQLISIAVGGVALVLLLRRRIAKRDDQPAPRLP